MAQEDGGQQHGEAHRRIGEKLLGARLAAGLTARQVSESTRITIEVLHRVEAGQFADCGGDIYARGHIRSYARAVGLDPEPLLVEYGEIHLPPLTKRDLRKPRVIPQAPKDAVPNAPRGAQKAAAKRARSVLPTIVPGAVPSLVPMAGANPPPGVPPLKHERRGDFTDADAGSAAAILDIGRGEPAINERPAAFLGGGKGAARTGPNWSLALVGALAAVGLVAAVQLWPEGTTGAPHPTATATTDGAVTAAQRHSVAPKPAAVPPATPSPSQTAPVDVRIAARSAPSWLGITNSAGKQLYWDILQPGQSQEFTDQDQLDVIIGDASAVDITVNGHHLTPPSDLTGQVLRATYNASSPQ
ncbi:MAG TPA: helix-turn-helix domain-containing protein [Actinocrinis sp.]|nr:helix-turn-helix domain-containing protein [Actinocrinis sp.]